MQRIKQWMTAVSAAVLLTACAGTGQTPTFSDDAGRVKVATSFYAMYEFTKAVAGDHVDLINLVPPGVEPHDWEPSSSVMKTLEQADLLVVNGAGMEHWVEKTISRLANKKLVVLSTAEGYMLLKNDGDHDDHHGHDDHDHDDHDDHAHDDHGHDDHDDHDHDDHHHDHDHDHGEYDPHIWLSPLGAIHQVEKIRDALSQVDPGNKAAYEQNAATYIEQLEQLDAEFEAGLSSCRTNKFFTTHAAFGYLANRYGLEQEAIMGLTPDAEPKSRELTRIVELAREHEIKYIFFETLVSDKVANVIANEIGAQTLVLNPLEGLTPAEIEAGKTYLSVMRENLKNLQLAMECGN